MGQPKVSVIIPVYNTEKYLRQCLDSVVNQTLKEIEIICVDDGSTDQSSDILAAAAQRDNRIIAIHQANQGAGPSRNAGICAAHGQYIAFLDADDWFPQDNTLEIMYEAAAKNAALICGGSLMNYASGKIELASSGGISYFFESEGWIEYKDFQQDYYYQRFIFDRKMLLNHSIFFPNYRRYQDPPFFLKAMITAGKFYAIPQGTYVYRVDAAHVNWTEQKVNDLLSALTDELILTSSAQLADLHYRIAHKVLNSDFYHRIIEDSLNQGNVEAGKKLGIFAHAIDCALIGKQASKLNFRYAEVLSSASIIPRCKTIHGDLSDPLKDIELEDGPKVTVVIPVYNTESYLAQCLDSVVNQTYRNLEILCVNDGSGDNSIAILEQYAAKDPRFVIINQKNGGLSAARNTGLRHATGQYVQFLDSDDLLETDTIEELIKYCQQKDLDMLLFDADSFFETAEMAKLKFHYKQYYYRRHSYNNIYSGVELLAALRKHDEYRSSACLLFLNREWLQKKQILFRNGILHEDNLFTFVCFLNAERCGHLGKRGYLRRIREDSIMTKPQTIANVRGYFECYIGMLDELSRHKIPGKSYPEVQLIVQEMWNSARKIYLNLQEKKMLPRIGDSFDMLMVTGLKGISGEQTASQKSSQTHAISNEKDNAAPRVTAVEVVSPEPLTWLKRLENGLLFIPRKIRGGIRCYREHGWYYTWQRILVHLHLREDPFK